jgi:glycosyltransferase involved in cell wall biosynthesis
MKKIEKILHFHPIEKYAAIFVGPLMAAEKKNGYDTKIITSDESNIIANWVIPYDLRFKYFFCLFRSFVQILRVLKAFKPDIVISHNCTSSLIPLFASWLKSVPNRIYFNHGVPYVGYSGISRLMLKVLERLNCYFSTEVITVSSDMRYLIKDVAPKAKVDYVNFGSACGINQNNFYPRRDSSTPFRVANQIESNDFLAVYIGRPKKRKGYEKCLSLWVENFKSSEYKLLLCGVTEENVLSFLSFIPKNVICIGFTKQIPQILREADCLLLPSYHEGFSYAALEALASGCLVLANNVDGIRNLITNNVNGILIDDNDQDNYIKYIKLIRSDPDTFFDIKSEGLIQAKKFSRDSFLDSYLFKLRDILSKSSI